MSVVPDGMRAEESRRTCFEQLFHSRANWGTLHIEHTFGHRGLRGHSEWRVIMTATLASTARSSARATVRTGTGVRKSTTSPAARPGLTRSATSRVSSRSVGKAAAASSCRVVVPAPRRDALALKLKVAAVAVVALVGLGVSGAEFSSWTEPDPAFDFVSGHPAWAHVSR